MGSPRTKFNKETPVSGDFDGELTLTTVGRYVQKLIVACSAKFSTKALVLNFSTRVYCVHVRLCTTLCTRIQLCTAVPSTRNLGTSVELLALIGLLNLVQLYHFHNTSNTFRYHKQDKFI